MGRVVRVHLAPALLRNGTWTVRGGVQPVVMFVILTVFGTNAVYWIYARAQELIEVRQMLAKLKLPLPEVAVRRTKAAPRGRTVDLRFKLCASLRATKFHDQCGRRTADRISPVESDNDAALRFGAA